MARLLSRIEIAKPDIVKYFDENQKGVYTKTELARVLTSNRGFWRLTQGTGANSFISFLMETSKLTELRLTSDNYSGFVRYAWGEVSAYQVALSDKTSDLTCHTERPSLCTDSRDQIPKTILCQSGAKPQTRTLGRVDSGRD